MAVDIRPAVSRDYNALIHAPVVGNVNALIGPLHDQPAQDSLTG